MLRSISLTRRSYSISNSFRKCYRLRITVRFNHNQARRPPSSPEITEGLFLHEAYNPLWSNSAPLTEATSFDDFGTSAALDFSNSSDLPLHQYLDNLLRPYPVTIETTAELGGRAELNDSERDSLETAIAEGYDVSAVLGDLYSSSIEQDPAATEELSIKPGFGLEHKTISAAANTENSIIPAIQPIIVAPQIPSTSYDIPSIQEEKEELFVPPHEQLLEAFENQDINSLKQVLKANPWPSSYDLGPHVNEILRFVVERSATSTEALQLLQNFIKQNPKYYLRDDLFIPLGIREIEENGVESAAEILKKAKALSYVKTNSRTRGLHREQYRQLFDSATRKEKLAGAVHMFKILSQLNMLNAQRDVRQWIEVVLTTECLEENVHTWKTISVLAGTTEGVDLLWDKLLLTPDGHRYIGSVMRHCQNLEHSLGTLSELICALVKNRLNEEAHMVFSKVYLMGRHLRRPLKRFLAARDLTSIEMLADLVTNCLFAEKRNRRAVKEEKTSKKSELSEALVKAVDSFSGKQPKILATKAKKEHKPKRHKINEEQLFAIATEIRDAWSKLATDEASKKKLTAWCNRNGVALLR